MKLILLIFTVLACLKKMLIDDYERMTMWCTHSICILERFLSSQDESLILPEDKDSLDALSQRLTGQQEEGHLTLYKEDKIKV